MSRKNKNSLYLIGDGDDVDILYDVEAAFGVKISDDEAPRLFTLGDLHDLLVSKLNASDARRSVCLTAVSFYRLRRALIELTGFKDISPQTRLDSVFPSGKIGPIAEEIEGHSAMKLPQSELGRLANAILQIVLFGTPALAIASGHFLIGGWGWAVLLLWTLVLPLLMFATKRPPGYCEDVGDLAKAMAGLNYGLLAAEFRVSHRDDVWNALVEVIKDQALSSKPVDRETTFFASAQ